MWEQEQASRVTVEEAIIRMSVTQQLMVLKGVKPTTQMHEFARDLVNAMIADLMTLISESNNEAPLQAQCNMASNANSKHLSSSTVSSRLSLCASTAAMSSLGSCLQTTQAFSGHGQICMYLSCSGSIDV